MSSMWYSEELIHAFFIRGRMIIFSVDGFIEEALVPERVMIPQQYPEEQQTAKDDPVL